MVDINMTSAVLFVVIASCFLITLYKLMSHWFVELLVVIFCIGGVEVRTISFSFLLSCILTFLCVKSPKWPNHICFENMVSILGGHRDSSIFSAMCNIGRQNYHEFTKDIYGGFKMTKCYDMCLLGSTMKHHWFWWLLLSSLTFLELLWCFLPVMCRVCKHAWSPYCQCQGMLHKLLFSFPSQDAYLNTY